MRKRIFRLALQLSRVWAALHVIVLSGVLTSQIVERAWYGWQANLIMLFLLVFYAFFLGYVRQVIKDDHQEG